MDCARLAPHSAVARGGAAMIYVEYGPMPVTKVHYPEVGQRLPDPPEGRDYHVCAGEDGASFVTEVSESEQHLGRHSTALAAVLGDVFGETPEIEPTIRPVAGIHRPGEQGATVY